MHFALWQLLWFDLRGSLRGLLSIRRNWRQLGLLLLMLLFVAFLMSAPLGRESAVRPGRFGSAMPFWALVYLLATWFTASADRGLVLRPAEIHFVVAGPFPGRDVITLSLLRLAFRSLLSAVILSLVALAYVSNYLSALVGLWLLFAVSLLVGMLASLSARRGQLRLVKPLRRLGTLLALGGVLLLIAQAMQAVEAAGQPLQVSTVAAAAPQTPLGQFILPPLAWMFAPLSDSNFWNQTLPYLPLRLLVIGLLVGMIYLLGSRFAEATAGRTDLALAKRQVALRSGLTGGAASVGWTRRVTLPYCPHWGGVGSVAWMQMLHSLRILPRYLIFTAAIVGVVLVIPLMVDDHRLAGGAAVVWMAGLTAYADFLLLLQLPVGFLGPVAQRELLKTLPIPAWRVAVGQLAGPVLPLAALHTLVLALFLYLAPSSTAAMLLTAVALIPVALLLVVNINLLGAWNIIRPRALQQRDALAAGRAMASVWIFMAMLSPAIVLSSVLAWLAALLLGPQLSSYLLGVIGGTIASSVFYIFLLARAFDRWQPTAAEGGMDETEYEG